MTLSGSFEIVLTLAFTIAAAYPIGSYMADVFENRKTFLTPLLGPVERALYRLAGVDPEVEQKWVEYALSMVVFGGGCLFALYALLRLQAYLPLNPQGFPGVPPDLAFNIAISFITNANWQAYGGETTLSHLSQMVGLTANNFLDSAAAIAIAVALIRALSRNEWTTIGELLGRYNAGDPLHPLAARSRRCARLRGARRSSDIERVDPGHDARRR
jgi:K+-transporting ATPase ATPase A chain